MGGLCKTLNYDSKTKLDDKIIEGRDLLFDMMSKLKDNMKGKSATEIYDMRIKHLQAMAKRNLPRDFIAEFTGEHFTHEGYDKEETSFQRCHKTGCDLISEQMPELSDRRLSTYSLPYTAYLLVEEHLEKYDDETLTGLHVEAYGDKTTFFNVCLEEIEKSNIIIEQLRRNRTPSVMSELDIEEESDNAAEIPESEEEKIKVLFESHLKDKSTVDLIKYMKIFDHGNTQILGIAHAKINKEYNKSFEKLRFKPQKRLIKPFTHPNADITTKFNATSCKSFPLSSFSTEFKDFLSKIFNIELKEGDNESAPTLDEIEDDDIALSQDFPGLGQSRGGNTLRVCR